MDSASHGVRRGVRLCAIPLAAALLTGACAGAVSPDRATAPPYPACSATTVSALHLAGLQGLPTIDTLLIRTHSRVLAHDSLGGRGTGSPGALAAARYIARQLEGLGARPLPGSAGSPSPYLLPVPLLRSDITNASLTLTTSSDEVRFENGAAFVVGRVGREGMHAAAGHVARLSADSTNVVPGSWLLLDAPLGEAAVRWLPIWKRAGVIGLVIRLPGEAVVAAYHLQLGNVRWHLREGEPDPVWQPDMPVVMVAPGVADRAFAPGATLRFDPHARVDTVVDYNVAGVVADTEPASDRLVALTAHYDHLGTVRRGSTEDSIFNGFSDNAAGVAMLLAIAATTTQDEVPGPLLFLFPAAEEVGLLGSLHFTRSHPDVVRRLQGVVNVDAGAPPAPPTRWRLAAGTRSSAGHAAAAVVEHHGWSHRADPGSPNSDHWPFVARDVPAVFLIPDGAYEGIDEAGTERLRARWDRYHRIDDEWAPDFPFAGLGRYARLARDIAWTLAALPGPCEHD